MEYSLGLVEVSALGNAIIMLDDMLKAADVEFVATERKLGGRLVTIVVRGKLTSVKASVDAGVARATKDGCLKASQVIAKTSSLRYLSSCILTRRRKSLTRKLREHTSER